VADYGRKPPQADAEEVNDVMFFQKYFEILKKGHL
jgi:hypothetical protein